MSGGSDNIINFLAKLTSGNIEDPSKEEEFLETTMVMNKNICFICGAKEESSLSVHLSTKFEKFPIKIIDYKACKKCTEKLNKKGFVAAIPIEMATCIEPCKIVNVVFNLDKVKNLVPRESYSEFKAQKVVPVSDAALLVLLSVVRINEAVSG